MKKIFLLIMVPFFLFSYDEVYVDFGKKGHMYDISEKNFLLTIKEELDEIDVQKIRNDLAGQVAEQATGENNLPACREDSSKTELDYIILKEDIYNPAGRLYQKKGTKVLAGIEKPLDVCFVDGTNMIALSNQIAYFDKKTEGKCIYMISNRNVLDVHKKYPDRSLSFFPSRERDEKRFNVGCLPTRVNMIGNNRTLIEHSFEKFKN